MNERKRRHKREKKLAFLTARRAGAVQLQPEAIARLQALALSGAAKIRTGKRTRTMKCSDCKRVFEMRAGELFRAARPRCPNCGGPLNKPRLA